MRVLFPVILILFLLAGSVFAQDLGSSVLPTEDEAIQALQLGDITYEQYLALLDLIQNGLDSTNLYLLDHFPALLYVADSLVARRSVLEQEQHELIQSYSSKHHSYLKYRGQHELEEGSRGAWRMSGRVCARDDLRLQFSLSRYIGGDQTFNTRNVEYRPDSGVVRRLTVGTFSEKFGLGTVVGYRGKLLDRDTSLSSESFLYPNYGGFNGACAEMNAGSFSIRPMLSLWRDPNYRLSTGAAMVGLPESRFAPSIILAATRLERRGSGDHLTDAKAAVNAHVDIFGYKVTSEFTYQAGDNRGFAAGVIEAARRNEKDFDQVSVWWYADRFIDLSSGSRSAFHTHHIEYAAIDDDISTRRSGQWGAQWRSSTAGEHWKGSGYFEVAGFGSDTIYGSIRYNSQYSFNDTWAFLIMHSRELEYTDLLDTSRVTQKAAFGLGFAYTASRLRARFMYRNSFDKYEISDYRAVSARIVWKSAAMGTFAFWGDYSRTDEFNVDRVNCYAQNSQPLTRNISLITKFMYEWDGFDQPREKLTVLGELEVGW